MDTIFRGRLQTRGDRLLAWTDALFVDHAVFRLAVSNFAAVAPGRLYRASHPTPGRLAALTRQYGLRTLINLRGPTNNGSDALSREMAARLGLAFVDAPLESRGAPQKERMLRLIETYRSMQEPALIHCKSGADRAGLAAGLFIMLQGGTARDALKQLSLRHGHIKQSKTGVLDAFFLRYQSEAEGKKPFINWLTEDYDRDRLRTDFKTHGLATFLNDALLRRE